MSPEAIAVALGLSAITLFVLSFSIASRPRGKREEAGAVKAEPVALPEASEARRKLKALEVERDFLADLVTRVYQARDRGDLPDDEASRIVKEYEGRLKRLNEEIAHNELLVRLQELEAEKGRIVRDFTERYLSIGKKIAGLRSKLGVAAAPSEPARPGCPAPEEVEERRAPVEEEVGRIIREIEDELRKIEGTEVEGRE